MKKVSILPFRSNVLDFVITKKIMQQTKLEFSLHLIIQMLFVFMKVSLIVHNKICTYLWSTQTKEISQK